MSIKANKIIVKIEKGEESYLEKGWREKKRGGSDWRAINSGKKGVEAPKALSIKEKEERETYWGKEEEEEEEINK